MAFERKQILDRLRAQIKEKEHVIGVAVGAGLSAKYAAKGGADLILVLNSGRFRQMGLGSIAGLLPFANCNQLVMEFGSREIIPIVKNIPVVFGLCATDPTIDLERYIEEIRAKGFSGINNYPSVGMIDGQFREALEEEGLSYDHEVEAIRIANRKGIFSIAFVFDELQAKKMITAGADVICAHLGVTKGGILGAKKTLSLEAATKVAKGIFNVCDEMKSGVIKMIYGGPINSPLDVKYMYDNTDAMGYLGGSSFERIPSEIAITNITREFKMTGQIEKDDLLTKMLVGITEYYDYITFVKEYVAQNYMTKISFSDLAIESHISRTYLSVLFKKEVGCTFPEYVSRYRINKAMEIMKSKKIALSEIASLIGYNDYAHFSKAFKKQTGHSPRDYVNDTKGHKYHI
ncbi:phosphoenolpyruvate hydrolase family protein [Pelosinus sp. sgz500959]|uniref:phosphoenolpyruvate hydrolase family protein n=1 Tax=Pelosinus sp. sgz500959 TaxID=3242472 RepID=UPI00366E5584